MAYSSVGFPAFVVLVRCILCVVARKSSAASGLLLLCHAKPSQKVVPPAFNGKEDESSKMYCTAIDAGTFGRSSVYHNYMPCASLRNKKTCSFAVISSMEF